MTRDARARLKTSQDFSRTLAKWLGIFSEMCRLEVSELLAKVYAEALKHLTAQQLDAACVAVARTHQAGRLPLPGDILAKVELANQDAKQLEAERAWEALQRQITMWGFDESRGWFMARYEGRKLYYAPEISDATDYALRQCGGLRAVIDCTDKSFPFMRKDFMAAYTRYTETAGLQMLGRIESRAILGKVRLGLPAADGRLGASGMQSIAEITQGDEAPR